MASNFTSVTAALTTTRALVYTAPASTSSIVFSGTVSNIDDAGLADHQITLEVLLIDGTTYRKVFNKVPVAYGQTMKLPKIALQAGEKLYVKADANSALEIHVSIVERT